MSWLPLAMALSTFHCQVFSSTVGWDFRIYRSTSSHMRTVSLSTADLLSSTNYMTNFAIVITDYELETTISFFPTGSSKAYHVSEAEYTFAFHL